MAEQLDIPGMKPARWIDLPIQVLVTGKMMAGRFVAHDTTSRQVLVDFALGAPDKAYETNGIIKAAAHAILDLLKVEIPL